MRLITQAALTCGAIGALRFVETLVSAPPHDGTPLLLLAILAGGIFWLSGALLGVVASGMWVVRRIYAPPVRLKPPPPAPPASQETRLRAWGFSAVAAWAGLSILTLIVMSETRTGPLAGFATGVLGLQEFAGLAVFLLGLPVFMAPLVVLAILPWQARWPLLAGMQAAVKPVRRARTRRRR